MNPIHKVLIDFSPNLIPTETLVFSLYLGKFANSLFIYLKSRNFCDYKLLWNKLLQNLFLCFWPEIDPQKTVLDK